MSEIRTFRCDVCGETFASDEFPNAKIGMDVNNVETEDDIQIVKTEVINYEHVCPKCINTIHRVLRNPNILRNKNEEISKLKHCINTLKRHIKDVSDKICGWDVHHDWDMYDTVYYEKTCENIENEYDDLVTSSRIWKGVAWFFIGFCISLIIARLVG